MGDRAQIMITEDDATGVYLYTHWLGRDIAFYLARALARSEDRWHDAPYLTRVVISEMVRDDIDGTTGVGVWHQSQEGPVIRVDVRTGTIWDFRGRPRTFPEFIAMTL